MSINEHDLISSEINELELLLNDIPKDDIIDRIGLESRLSDLKLKLDETTYQVESKKAVLTFRGQPVFGTHGISADFASKVLGIFTDAVAAVAVAVENMSDIGPIPDKQNNTLIITNTAIGSFGFELEIPENHDNVLFPEPNNTEQALDKILNLFDLSSNGNDDDLTKVVDDIHPRAVKKVVDFLNALVQAEAWCNLNYNDRYFRFDNLNNLNQSVSRLKEDNIHEEEISLTGEFQGILPKSRTFEFNTSDNEIIKGKISSDIDDPDILNRDYLHKNVDVKLKLVRVGEGKPSYTLENLTKISMS